MLGSMRRAAGVATAAVRGVQRRAQSTAVPRIRAPRFVALCGSDKEHGANFKLLTAAVAKMKEVEPATEITVISPAQAASIPLFTEATEAAGVPEAVTAMKAAFVNADAMLIACPEYNGSITPLLKNTLDWLSRSQSPEEAMYAAFKGKAAAVMAASPGGLGGLRGLVHVRDCLGFLGANVIAEQVAVGASFKAFTDDGKLADERHDGLLEATVHQLFRLAAADANHDATCDIARMQRSCAEYGEIIL